MSDQFEERRRQEAHAERKEAAQALGVAGGLGTVGVVAVVLVTSAFLFGCPSYNVYASRKHGEAELAQSQGNRQIAVQEALALYESADYKAKAEVRRAEGVAQANKIIGDSLKNNEAYLRYLYVNNLADTKDQVIYIPTEAGMPILEAGQRPTAPKAPQ